MSLPANAPQGSRFDRLVQRLKDCCGEDVFVILIAVVIGLFAGFAAFVLKTMIGYTTNLLTGHLSAGHFNLVLLVYPLAGIVLTGLYQRYVIHRNIEHGVERIEQGLRERRYNLGKKYIYSPMIASTLTLGFGGSAGSEGPIATVGGAIGGSVARRLGLSPETIRVLVGCGAGAGVAGIVDRRSAVYPRGFAPRTQDKHRPGPVHIVHSLRNDGIRAERMLIRYKLRADYTFRHPHHALGHAARSLLRTLFTLLQQSDVGSAQIL